MTITLDNALSIYNYDFLEPDTAAWVAKIYKHPTAMRLIRASMTIVSSHTDDQELRNAVKYRSPVYFGRHMPGYFDVARFEATFGYTLSDVPEPVSYAVLGLNLTPLPGGRAAPFWTVHLMGVNLEAPTTRDYRRLVTNDELDLEAYALCVIDMVACLETGVVKLNLDSPRIRMPAIGCGSYLQTFPQHTIRCTCILLDALTAMLTRHSPWSVEFCSFSPKICERYADGMSRLHVAREDLFATEVTNELVLCNAWDSSSFIGNGGSRDLTVDGMFVAGGGSGRRLINCSYLHNHFLSGSSDLGDHNGLPHPFRRVH